MPTEKEGATTTKIVLTVPAGFSIDSFVAAPGWKRERPADRLRRGHGVQKVTWTGGDVPTEEDSFFQFLGEPSSAKTYTFTVAADATPTARSSTGRARSRPTRPAPTVEAKSSLGGGGSSTLTIVALVVGAIGVVARRRSRSSLRRRGGQLA